MTLLDERRIDVHRVGYPIASKVITSPRYFSRFQTIRPGKVMRRFHHSKISNRKKKSGRSKFFPHEVLFHHCTVHTFSQSLRELLEEERDFQDSFLENIGSNPAIVHELESIVKSRLDFISLMDEATMHARAMLDNQLLMTGFTYLKCLKSIQFHLWKNTISPALRDQIYLDHGINLNWLRLQSRLQVEALLPGFIQKTRTHDLEVFRKYVMGWARRNAEDMIDVFEVICKSPRPWCIFEGMTWLQQHEISKPDAKKAIQKLVRRKWIQKVDSVGRKKYYSLCLDRIHCSRYQAQVDKKSVPFRRFVTMWQRSIAKLETGCAQTPVVRETDRIPKNQYQFKDYFSAIAFEEIERRINTLDLNDFRYSLFQEILHLLPRFEELIPKFITTRFTSPLKVLAQPMLERRMLVQVVLPLVLGLRQIEMNQDYFIFLRRKIVEFYEASSRSLLSKINNFRESQMEYATGQGDTYLPGIFEPLDRNKNLYESKKLYSEYALSKWLAENLITEFATMRGVRTFMERHSTRLVYAGWERETYGRFPNDQMNWQLARAYMDRYDADSRAELVAKFSNPGRFGI